MRTLKILSFIMLSQLLVTMANAQANRLSLEQALEKAYQNNRLLQVNELEFKSAQMGQKAIITLPKTNITAILGQFNSIRFDENVTIVQDIPNPANIKAQRELAGQEAILAQKQIAISKQDLGYAMRQSWYQWLYLRELKKALNREDSLLLAFEQAAAAKYKAGESRLLEKTTAEARRQQLLQNLAQVEMLMRVEQLKMQQQIGMNEAFEPEGDSLQMLNLANGLDTAALANHPMMQYIKQQMALSEANVKLAKTEQMPDFSAGYFIQSVAGPQDVNGQTRVFTSLPQFQGLNLGISVPIFAGKAYKAKQEMFATQKLAQAKQAENLQWHLQQGLEQNLAQALFWQQNLQYYRQVALPNAEEIISNASKAYKSGEIEYVEYLQALQTGLELRKSYLEAANNLNQNILSMQYLLGQ